MKALEQRIRDLEAKMQTAVRFAPGGGAVAAARLTVGGGTAIAQVTKYQVNVSIGAISAQSTFTANIFVPGLAMNDWVIVNPPGPSSCPMSQAWVNSPGTMQVVFINPTTAAQTPPAGIYTVIAIRA